MADAESYTKYYNHIVSVNRNHLEKIRERINENDQSLVALDEQIKQLNDSGVLTSFHTIFITVNLSIFAFYLCSANRATNKECYWDYDFSWLTRTSLHQKDVEPWTTDGIFYVVVFTFTLAAIYGAYTCYHTYSTGCRLKKTNKVVELYKQKDVINENIFQMQQQKYLQLQNLIHSDFKDWPIEQKILFLELIEKYIN